jgi:L-arabinokinase
MIAVYVSGHGFGHSTRTAEVLRELRGLAPDLPITVTTSAPSFLFEGLVPPPLSFRPVECDIGLVQRDALVIDEPGTAARWREFAAGWEGFVTAEAAWLRSVEAHLVVADIPPLAFAAAHAAGVPSVAVGNFSWDWIYDHLAGRQPALGEAADVAREAYARAEVLLRLPFAGDLSAFRAIEDVPLVARQPSRAREEARRALGWGKETVVLLSFGGPGLPGIDLPAYGALSEYRFVLTGASGEGESPANLVRMGGEDLERAGLEYPDLVGAADVVVTKPGYGIVTDCIAAGTRMVYTDRGDFPEYPILTREMVGYFPAVYATNEEVRGGMLGRALEEVLGLTVPERPRIDGAKVVAERVLRRLGRGT